MKDSGGHVVALAVLPGEFLDGRENVAEKIERNVARKAAANVLNASEAKLLIVDIAGFRQTIGAEDHGIAGLKLEREFVVGDAGEKARRDAGKLKDAAILSTEKQGARHSRAGNDHFAGGGIEDRVLDHRVTSGYAAEVKSFIEEGKNSAGSHASLMDTPESADGERGVESGGKPLAGDVADIKAKSAVGESEIVEEVTADFGGGLKLVRDDDVVFVEGL
jgi:hypothetical protein